MKFSIHRISRPRLARPIGWVVAVVCLVSTIVPVFAAELPQVRELPVRSGLVADCQSDVRTLTNGLGSVLATLDSSVQIVSARKYDVYGAVRSSTGPSGTKHKFVGSLGHPSDDETGLIYMRAWYYDPVTGRFVSQDPARHGANWYAYADSNPVGRADRSGKEAFSIAEISMTSDLGQAMDSVGMEIVMAELQGTGEAIIVTELEGAGVMMGSPGASFSAWLQGIGQNPEMWTYAAKEVSRAGGVFLKAWLRWNVKQAAYDAFLIAEEGVAFASHATPYVGTVLGAL